MGGKRSGLSLKEHRFVVAWCETGNFTHAVKAAGYNTRYPAELAYQIRNRPHVAAKMEEIRAQLDEEAKLSLAKSIEGAMRARDFAIEHKNPNAVVKAEELIAKLSGHLDNKITLEVEHKLDLSKVLNAAEQRVAALRDRIPMASKVIDVSVVSSVDYKPDEEPDDWDKNA